MRPEQTLLARYLGYLLDGICPYLHYLGKDERVKFWGQKVKGQSHGRVKYSPKCTFGLCSCHMLAEA